MDRECIYCERHENPSGGFDQPALCDLHWRDASVIPDKVISNMNRDGESDWEARVYDFQTASPQLILTSKMLGEILFGEDAKVRATIHIPIKNCPVCGRKLGNRKEK